MDKYDMQFGEHFYDYSWHSGISHNKLMKEIKVPTIFLHIKDSYTSNGILQCASSDEQARKAVELMPNASLTEITGNHDIHRFSPKVFLNAVQTFLK